MIPEDGISEISKTFCAPKESGLHNSLFSRVCYEVSNFLIDTSLQIALVSKLHSPRKVWDNHIKHCSLIFTFSWPVLGFT